MPTGDCKNKNIQKFFDMISEQQKTHDSANKYDDEMHGHLFEHCKAR